MTRDQILARAKTPRHSEPVDVPELGGTVHVAVMSGAERDAMAGGPPAPKEEGRPTILTDRARTLVRAIRDESGARIFTDADADALGEMDSDILKRLYDVAARINGLDDDE